MAAKLGVVGQAGQEQRLLYRARKNTAEAVKRHDDKSGRKFNLELDAAGSADQEGAGQVKVKIRRQSLRALVLKLRHRGGGLPERVRDPPERGRRVRPGRGAAVPCRVRRRLRPRFKLVSVTVKTGMNENDN